MAWYWIVLIVLGYFFMAITTTVMWMLYWKLEDEDLDVATCIGFFLWWALFPYLLIALVSRRIFNKIKK